MPLTREQVIERLNKVAGASVSIKDALEDAYTAGRAAGLGEAKEAFAHAIGTRADAAAAIEQLKEQSK